MLLFTAANPDSLQSETVLTSDKTNIDTALETSDNTTGNTVPADETDKKLGSQVSLKSTASKKSSLESKSRGSQASLRSLTTIDDITATDNADNFGSKTSLRSIKEYPESTSDGLGSKVSVRSKGSKMGSQVSLRSQPRSESVTDNVFGSKASLRSVKKDPENEDFGSKSTLKSEQGGIEGICVNLQTM